MLIPLLVACASDPAVLNEVMPAHDAESPDPFVKQDWVELYNPSDKDYPLAGHALTKAERLATGDKAWDFPEDTVVPAGGYLSVFFGDDGTSGGLGATFQLNRDTDTLVFLRDEEELEDVSWNSMPDGHSWGRLPDGEGEWRELEVPTPEAANGSSGA